jgi:hypothetical protein
MSTELGETMREPATEAVRPTHIENRDTGQRRMVIMAAACGIWRRLRPAARGDLANFLKHIRGETEARAFVDWAAKVLRASGSHRSRFRSREVVELFRNAPPGLFRHPERAFRPRA